MATPQAHTRVTAGSASRGAGAALPTTTASPIQFARLEWAPANGPVLHCTAMPFSDLSLVSEVDLVAWCARLAPSSRMNGLGASCAGPLGASGGRLARHLARAKLKPISISIPIPISISISSSNSTESEPKLRPQLHACMCRFSDANATNAHEMPPKTDDRRTSRHCQLLKASVPCPCHALQL